MDSLSLNLRGASSVPLSWAQLDANFLAVQSAIQDLADEISGISAGVQAWPEQFGAVGNEVADDLPWFNAALAFLSLAGGGALRLTPWKSYRLSSRLGMPSKCAMVGDGTATIVAKAADFNNTSLAGKYLSNSAVIDCSGEVSGSFTPSTNITLRGFKIKSEVSDGRLVDAITARNVKNLVIQDLEIFGFPVGCGVRASTLSGRSSISLNHIHDFTTALNTYGSQPQITGIELDGDRVNGVGSSGFWILANRIEDITMTGAALSTYGMQTDGINIQGSSSPGASPSVNGQCSLNFIRNVGEGIDHFGSYCTFVGNTAQDCYEFGMKLIYGSSFNDIVGGTFKDCGRAGIVIAGSNTAGVVNDTERNTFIGVNIAGVNPQGRSLPVAPCIYLQDGSVSKPRNNTFMGCSGSMGANGTHGWYDSSTGDRNLGIDMRFFTGGSTVKRVFVNSGAGGAVRMAGSPYWITDSVTPTIASAATITPRNGVTIVTGTNIINSMSAPEWVADNGGEITLFAAGAWSTSTSGNIAAAFTAVVGMKYTFTWDPSTGKWYPN